MARIVYAWDHGPGIGPIARGALISAALRKHGHQIAFVLRDLALAPLLGKVRPRVFQAPVWSHPTRGVPKLPRSHADLLAYAGWNQPAALLSVTASWIDLIDALKPELIITDGSPAAALAARKRKIPVIFVGDGLSLPPLTEPLPAFQSKANGSDAAAKDAEASVLSAVQKTAKALNLGEVKSLAQLYLGKARLLCTFPEFDPYGPRKGQKYVGPLYVPPKETAAYEWPKGKGTKLVAYVRPDWAGLQAFKKTINDLGWRVLFVMPSASKETVASFSSGDVIASNQPVGLSATKDADFVALHGGLELVSELARRGKPLLLLPLDLEQHLLAARVMGLGIGLATKTPVDAGQLKSNLEKLQKESVFSERAGLFKKKYGGYTPGKQLGTVVKIIQGLFAQPTKH